MLPVLPLVAIGVPAICGAATSAWAYFSAQEAKANAENTKNLVDLETAHAANPARKIQAAALLAAAIGASFVGYKYASRK